MWIEIILLPIFKLSSDIAVNKLVTLIKNFHTLFPSVRHTDTTFETLKIDSSVFYIKMMKTFATLTFEQCYDSVPEFGKKKEKCAVNLNPPINFVFLSPVLPDL